MEVESVLAFTELEIPRRALVGRVSESVHDTGKRPLTLPMYGFGSSKEIMQDHSFDFTEELPSILVIEHWSPVKSSSQTLSRSPIDMGLPETQGQAESP